MTAGIMQPYLFPYLGYFQLMQAVDRFVLYDNVEYSKKGWINRNRILVNGQDSYISLPLRKDSDFLQIGERQLADAWPAERKKMLNRITASYAKAPFYKDSFPLIESALMFDDSNLFNFIHHSLVLLKSHFEIPCEIIVSSSIPGHESLKSEQKVIAICKELKAGTYINAIGGQELYQHENFKSEGIELHFIKMKPFEYKQFNNEFIPFLSIIDVMMFNSRETIKDFLNSGYTLI
jgi:hypothetical protein